MELLEHIIDLDIRVRVRGLGRGWQDLPWQGSDSTRAPHHHHPLPARLLLSIPQRWLCPSPPPTNWVSLLYDERAHTSAARQSEEAITKAANDARETCTHSPRVFLSLEGMFEFESTFWKLDRPSPTGLLVARIWFHRGGSGFGCQSTFCFGGEVFYCGSANPLWNW